MKTEKEIRDEVCQDKWGMPFCDAVHRFDTMEVIEFITEFGHRYATEAIKADRERVKSDAFFKGVLNEKRIKSYKDIAKDYNVSESTIRDLFSLGITFAVAEFKNLPIELP